jgi:hypothetical protein
MPYPRGASALAPPKERKEGGQRRATREEGGNETGRKQLCTRPAANTRSPAGTAASATDAPTKRTYQARIEHTATVTGRGQADKKQKGPRSQGMQKRRRVKRKDFKRPAVVTGWRPSLIAPLVQAPTCRYTVQLYRSVGFPVRTVPSVPALGAKCGCLSKESKNGHPICFLEGGYIDRARTLNPNLSSSR